MEWNQFEYIIFERGISLEKNDSRWSCSTADKDVLFDSVNDVIVSTGYRPLLLNGAAGNANYYLVVPYNYGRFLDIYRSELSSIVSRSILFSMGACLFQIRELAKWCSKFCINHAQSKHKPDVNKIVTSPETPYFLFEALITDIVRGFNVLRYHMWQKWGSSGGVPNSFERTIDRLVSIPEDLITILEEKKEILIRAKKFRDCIQHYVDIGSSSWVMLEKLPIGSWSAFVRVPDNPERRSSKYFKFNEELDALTLGWEFTSELCQTVATIFNRQDLIHGSTANQALNSDG